MQNTKLVKMTEKKNKLDIFIFNVSKKKVFQIKAFDNLYKNLHFSFISFIVGRFSVKQTFLFNL